MSRLQRFVRWLLRQGAEAAVAEITQDRANPGNKAKKAPLRLVGKGKP